MTFEEKISVPTPFFQANKFIVAESHKGYIKYESEYVTIIIGSDPRENSISVFVGKKGANADELSGDLISNFFDDNTKLVNDQFFAENLMQFLNGKGNAILRGDLNILTQLEEYTNLISKEYTANLIARQNINAADKAWAEKKYADFITHVDKIKKEFLPQSYLMKYQIALKKIG